MGSVKYRISADNEFVIENYNSSSTFSSFFPGIAGIFGIPMWVFYANRGQCITSFGVQDKDGAILEFQPANKAYKSVALNGFRTFLKVDGKLYEPFSERSPYPNEMRICPCDLKLLEDNTDLKIRTEVSYFTLPGERFPALIRTLKVTNLSSKKSKIEALDGLPTVIPKGFGNALLKNMSQTIEAWSIVENLDNNAPFIRLKVVPSDAPETKLTERGNFYLSFVSHKGKESEAGIIVRRRAVFGEVSSLEYPGNFSGKDFVMPRSQLHENFIPCAFSYKKLDLAAKGNFELFSVIGDIDSIDELNRTKARILSKKYIERKYAENKNLIEGLTSPISTASSSKSFDLYSRQTFLDNVMRGGVPITIGDHVFYAFYRKHGDMERDYNDFKLIPSYYSQGIGNYRDINQNRRNDLFFNPDVKSSNIERFFNLIQLDGFNPLVIQPTRYVIDKKEVAEALVKKHIRNDGVKLVRHLQKHYLLGVVLKSIEDSRAEFTSSREAFVKELLDVSTRVDDATHGEGYWTDHFSYNTDLLESYGSIYPESVADLLFGKKTFTFYDSDYIVLDRKSKYIAREGRISQLRSVKPDFEKRALIDSRSRDKNIVRKDFGRGEIFKTNLISKILCIIANKAASFDAEGIGIEMEADKPDWYDALNGLPGLFGSSLSETLELKRLCEYVLKRLDYNVKFDVPVEISELLNEINKEMLRYFELKDSFRYWDAAYSIKESFRARTKLGLSGIEDQLNGEMTKGFIENVVTVCDLGIKRSLEKYGNYYTYFINEPVGSECVDGIVKINKFVQKPLPLFLEGFVHALKVEKDPAIYMKVKNSPLYDAELKMYKVNAPLGDTSIEIGRAKVFSPGWLENESIWLHMEYKFMLELLKAGMYKEFFADFKNVLVPFMDPKVYKRSILENSSFISSSAYPEKENHGRGFVARLSGCAAEFIDIWIRMAAGSNIFYMDKEGGLCFKLSPILPSWMFNEGKFSFKLLGSIDVTYLNKKNKDTFGGGVSPVSYKLEYGDRAEVIDSSFISGPAASVIRERKVKKIIVSLA